MESFILINILFITISYSQPQIESINPFKISGGTGELIKIKGKNLGNESSGEINFYCSTENGCDYYHTLDSLNFWYYGLIWNDTLIITELPDFANSGYVFVKNKVESNRKCYEVNFKYMGSKWNKNCNFIFSDNCPTGKKYFEEIKTFKGWNSDKFSFSFNPGQTDFKQNGVNEIGWGKIVMSRALALTKTYTQDNEITECDIILDSNSFDWNCIDFRAVIMHELGHALGLDDLCSQRDKNKLMFGNMGGWHSNTLTQSEIEGYNWIYNANITSVKQKREEKVAIPSLIFGNYPNPFNNETKISITAHTAKGLFTLRVYNVLGQIINSWSFGQQDLKISVPFEPDGSGVYFANLYLDNKVISSIKMLAVK